MSKKKRMGRDTSSKGERKNVSLSNRVHKDERPAYKFEKAINQLKAWRKGKKVAVKVPSANNPHILESIDANEAWGDWKGRDKKEK